MTVRPGANVTLPGPDYVDLYLRIDPDAATVQPRYAVTAGGVTGPLTDLGGSEPVPSGWFTGSTGLAIGIISTSSGPGAPFPATWDFIEAVPETVTDPSAIAQDTFTRTVTNSWGTADVGGPWTVVAGAAANFDVDGARGTVATPGGSQQQVAHLGQVSVRDVDLRVALTFPDAPTASGNFFGYLLLRRQANGSYYRVGLYVTPGGKVFIRGQTDAGANLFPDVDTGLSFAAGDTFLLRVQAEGASPTTIRARAWEQGTAEPASWQATATDSTAGLQQAGSVGIRTVNLSSTATTLRFDDLLGKQLQPVLPPPGQDTFTRTVTNSWGTADVGGPWTVVAGAAANFDVDGARGTVATPGGSQQQVAHLGQVSVRDVDLRVALTFPDAPTASGNFFGYLLLRRQANGSYYRVGLFVTPGGKVFIRGQTDAGANLFPDVDTGLSFAAGDTFLLRVQAEGASPTTIRARAWEQGTAEPASWQATATDSHRRPPTGRVRGDPHGEPLEHRHDTAVRRLGGDVYLMESSGSPETSLSIPARKIHHLQVTVEVGEERLRAQPLLPQPPASHLELLELLPRDGGVELGHPVGHGAEVDLVHPHTEPLPVDREIERQHAVGIDEQGDAPTGQRLIQAMRVVAQPAGAQDVVALPQILEELVPGRRHDLR